MSEQPTWQGLTPGRRRWLALAVPVQLTLLGIALKDVLRRSPAELTAPRPVWVAVCFVNFVGPLAYFAFGRRPHAD